MTEREKLLRELDVIFRTWIPSRLQERVRQVVNALIGGAQPAEDERAKELIQGLNIAMNSCRDITTLGRFATSVDPLGWVKELQAHLESVAKSARSLLPVKPAQQEDDGWVTFGRIKTDIESETETFERIPVQPATPANDAPTCNPSCERWVGYGAGRRYDPTRPCTCGAHLSVFPRPAAASTEAQNDE